MSDTKKHRPINEIQADYQSTAMKAGHIQYQIYTLSKDLELVNSTLRDLNLEAVASQGAESKEAEAK